MTGDVFPFFVVGVLHLVSAAVLAFGGIYHAVLGPEVITSPFEGDGWFVRVDNLQDVIHKEVVSVMPLRRC